LTSLFICKALPNQFQINSCDNITERGIKELGQALQTLVSLETFNFSMREHDNFTGQAMGSLASGIKQMSALKSIELDFWWCIELEDAGIQRLGETLTSLPLLQSAKFDLTHCQVAEQGMLSLGQGLKSLTCLTKLHLNFQSCEHLTDTAVQNLCEGLAEKTSLLRLTLDFTPVEDPSELTDLAVEEVSRALRNLTSLQKLSIGFRECKEITDTGFVQFCRSLKTLTSLKKISIDFSCCTKITATGIQALGEALKSLVLLVDVHLLFFQYSGKAIEGHIEEILEKLPLLEKSIIRFYRF